MIQLEQLLMEEHWSIKYNQIQTRMKTLHDIQRSFAQQSDTIGDVIRSQQLLLLLSVLESEIAGLFGLPILIDDVRSTLSTTGWKMTHLVNLGLISDSFGLIFSYLVQALDHAVKEEVDEPKPAQVYITEFGGLKKLNEEIECLVVKPLKCCIDFLKRNSDEIILKRWKESAKNERIPLNKQFELQYSGHFVDPVLIYFMQVSID